MEKQLQMIPSTNTHLHQIRAAKASDYEQIQIYFNTM